MPENKTWTVTEVNSVVKTVLEGAIGSFWMEAEIGTMTIHSSGHVYLVLKDDKSQIKAVIWKGSGTIRSLKLETGSKIEVFGALSVYEVRGEYQFTIREIRKLGIGDLQKKFEEIKDKLNKEGLFDQSRKKAIPMLPKKIGIITSPTGAAIADFLTVISRRYPNVNIRIYPSAVQGDGAEKELIKGIKFFNECQPDKVDVIVLSRGGGSMEDLWAFNNESLARAIASSLIPVISAVGHEIDFTISDFVADLRVPTPSAAAELVASRQDELNEKISNFNRRLLSSITIFLERKKRSLESAKNCQFLKDPMRIVFEKQQTIDEISMKLFHNVSIKLEKERSRFNGLLGKMQTLNPNAVLSRGYSMLINKKSGKVISSAADVSLNDELLGKLYDGNIDLIVKEPTSINS